MRSLRLGPYRFRPPGLVPSIATALVLAVLLGLGLWQLGRADEKALRVEQWNRRGALAAQWIEPGELSAPARAALRDAPVRARGRYVGERQFLLDNRTEQGRAGYHVLTALRLDPPAGGGEAGAWGVLVNRGWVPLGPRRDVLPPVPAPGGPVEVRGIGAAPREDQLILGDAGYAEGGWPRVVQRVEIAAMEQRLGLHLQPLVVLLAPDAPGGYVRSWQPHLGIPPERHLAYAFQWFALAAALAIIYLAVNCRRAAPGGRLAEHAGRER